MKSAFIGVMLVSTLAVDVYAAPVAQPTCDNMLWIGREAEYEALLLEGEPQTIEEVGMGVTDPKKVVLKVGDQTLKAVFKPIERGRQKGYWESYQAEIVAYELDKLLELHMVPPTVVRDIKGERGSLQLWIDDCKLYKEVEGQVPPSARWSQALSCMKIFDNLICNRDRNAGNFFVNKNGEIILIDHSRAFLTEKNIEKDPKKLPNQYERILVEKMRALDLPSLEQHFGDLLMGNQIEALAKRRDELLKHVDQLVAKSGESAILFKRIPRALPPE